MHLTRFKRPSPALVVAMVALFVALGGTAGAVVAQAVPLAKRALVADKAKFATTAKTALVAENAKKLGGQTSSQIVQQATSQAVTQAVTQASQAPGPASTAAAIVSIKTASASIGPGIAAPYAVACDAGQKVMGGGFSSDGPLIIIIESRPLNDTTWQIGLLNLDSSAGYSVTVYATCIR